MKLALFTAAALILSWSAPAAAQAPEITSVAPAPLPVGASAQIQGTGFVDGDTTVWLGELAQKVVFAAATEVVFVVGLDVPLGASELKVTTAQGSATLAVEVVSAPPKIVQVLPDPVVMGVPATVHGSDLAAVTEATVAGQPVTIVEQTDALIVVLIPVTGALLGSHPLTVTSPFGTHSVSINVVAPPPEIDSIAPNPARQGDLVTVTGKLVSPGITLHVQSVDVPLVLRQGDSLVVQVPDQLAPGPHEMVAKDGEQSSAPAGPLHVTAAKSTRPAVEAVYPGVVTQGGLYWVVGLHLHEALLPMHGELIECVERACRVAAPGAEGSWIEALTGTTGTTTYALKVTAGEAAAPVEESALPNPVFVGHELTLLGSGLLNTTTVVLGGVEQAIVYQDATTVRVTVSHDTPLGSEAAFVAGSAGSNAVMVTVLESFETPTADDGGPGPEVAPEAKVEPADGPDPGPGLTSDAATSDVHEQTAGSSAGSGGCNASPGPSPAWGLVLWMLALVGVRRARAAAAQVAGPAPR